MREIWIEEREDYYPITASILVPDWDENVAGELPSREALKGLCGTDLIDLGDGQYCAVCREGAAENLIFPAASLEEAIGKMVEDYGRTGLAAIVVGPDYEPLEP